MKPYHKPELRSFPPLNLAELERRAIAAAMLQTRGNVPRAAQLLGIGRSTLFRKLATARAVPTKARP
jgi:transcriptional regulator of acetoin/glycerol metabolism